VDDCGCADELSEDADCSGGPGAVAGGLGGGGAGSLGVSTAVSGNTGGFGVSE